MRKILLTLFLVAVLFTQSQTVFAAEEKTSNVLTDTTDKIKDSAKEVAEDVQNEVDQAQEKLENTDMPVVSSSLVNDLRKAREIITDGAKKDSDGNSFLRGMIIAMLQPIFIASMFCLGLWAGQMSEKLKHIWVLPVIVYAATIIGAFITAYHSEWKPDETHYKFLHALQSTEVVSVIIGLILGIFIALQFSLPSFLAMLCAVAIGLVLGFSQTSDVPAQQSVMPFWAGFGLTGLLLNIFGIGFETFFQSINFKIVTRLLGVATAVLSVYIGAKLL